MKDERDFLSSAAAPTPDCLSPYALEQFAAGTPEERTHLDDCPFCQTQLALLTSFEASEPSAAEVAAVSQITARLASKPAWRPQEAPSPARWWMARPIWALGVAALAAVFGFGVFLRDPRTATPPAEDLVRSSQIEGVQPKGDVAQPPQALSWRPVAGAASYRVWITDIEDATLWQITTAESTMLLPAGAQALMQARKTLAWHIQANGPRGEILARSQPEPFRVVPK